MSRKRAKSSEMARNDSQDDIGADGATPVGCEGLAKPFRSYAAMLRQSEVQSMMEEEEAELTDADCSYIPGKHGLNLQFSERVLGILDRQWKHAVIVNLMGRPNSVNSYEFILRGLRRKWRSTGGWKLIDLLNNYFIVRFELEEDMNEALCGGPWVLAGQTLVVRRWSAGFDVRTDKVGSMAVWTRIIGLPVRFFTDYAMSKIGKLLGEVVKVDKVTLNQERGRYARVCVEMDLGKPFSPVVEVDGSEYKVQYEGLSLLCFQCGVYGHTKDNCSAGRREVHSDVVEDLNDEMVLGDKEAGLDRQETHMGSMKDSASNAEVVEEGFGPWMLIDYKSRKKAGKAAAQKRETATGSRFAALLHENKEVDLPSGIEAVSVPSMQVECPDQPNTMVKSPPVSKSVPEIIQMWSSLQNSLKEKEILGPGVYLDNVKDAADISGLDSKLCLDNEFKIPLVRKSNTATQKTKGLSKSVRKGAGGPYRNKNPSTGENIISFQNPNLNLANFSGFFGRCPPEEIVTKELIYSLDSNMGIEKLVPVTEAVGENGCVQEVVPSAGEGFSNDL